MCVGVLARFFLLSSWVGISVDFVGSRVVLDLESGKCVCVVRTILGNRVSF